MSEKKNTRINVKLSVVIFKENNIHIAYCPAVNVYGYGESEGEAQKSFEVSLSEFFRYTINKKTLATELKALGWKVKGDNKMSPPNMSSLLSRNSEFQTIFNTKPFSKFDKGFNIPLPA